VAATPSTSAFRRGTWVCKPVGIDHVSAAALPQAGLTAWQALVDTADLRPRQRVLIHAAAGGVGHLAVQIAKHRGAHVVGTARADKHASLRYGGDYNPEQWPEDVWDDDIRLMIEAGVNLVTVGVFSWSFLETGPGHFEFGWLDRILDKLHSAGIRVDLATGTASPPPWLTTLHPEILPVDERGTVLWPGSRQHYSPSAPAYRRYAARFVEKLAQRYGAHPALEMWHINNEYGCHTNVEFSESSAVAFRSWLERRYGDVETLNEAWGTAFWSQRYRSFAEVLPPRVAPNFRNPGQLLDYRRFSSDALLECFLMEKAILRSVAPHIPVTTNFIGAFKPVDYWKWAPHVDVISDDSYPDPYDPDATVKTALTRDLMRSLGGGKPWLLMEQATGHVQWRPTNATKSRKQLFGWSHQAIARGADGICFFQWRQSAFGAEKFHSAMLPHSGTRGRIWPLVRELGEQLGKLAPVTGTTSSAKVAILLDWSSWWAAETDAHPQTIDVLSNITEWYRALYERNVAVDFAHPDHDLAAYPVVLAPNLYLMSASTTRSLASYVEQGGTLLVTYFSGIVDEREHVHLGGYLADLRDALGVWVDDFAPLALTEPGPSTVEVGGPLGRFTGSIWSEYAHTNTAQIVAEFLDTDVAGSLAVTRNAYGRGAAWYVATQPDAAGIGMLVDRLLTDTGTTPVVEKLPSGVEATRRGDFLFLVNQGSGPVELDISGLDLVSGTDSDRHVIRPGQALVIEAAVSLAKGCALHKNGIDLEKRSERWPECWS
jgi:beta-galactosidase